MELRPTAIKGKDLRYQRRLAGIQTRELAYRLGITEGYLARIEGGSRSLEQNPRLILKCAEILGVSLSEIAEVEDVA